MALDRFKKSAINGENGINLDAWHSPTGGFTAIDAGNIQFQDLKGIRKEGFELATDAVVEQENLAKSNFKKQSANGRKILQTRTEVAKETVKNNIALTDHIKAIANVEVSNQRLKGTINKHLQENRVQLARIKADGMGNIEDANSKVSAIFSASKESIKESIL
jgi:hypothetical protein